MRIAILTFHRAYNCGAMLQAWALQTVLERMGHQVFFPSNGENSLGGVPYRSAFAGRTRNGTLGRIVRSFIYRLVLTCLGRGGAGVRAGIYYEEFRRRWLKEMACDLVDISKCCDVVLIGSDQVINPRIFGWTDYFCGLRVSGVSKIMYAASAGDGRMSDAQQDVIRRAIAECKSVSVREPFDGRQVVLDPTLLLCFADYQPIETPPAVSGYVYMYSCLATEFEVRIAREIARKLHRKLIITPTWGLCNRKREKDICDIISPDRMIGYIKNADYVIAGSFHGTALSVVYRKHFISIRDHIDVEESRSFSFLKKLHLENRLVNPSNTVSEMIRRLTDPISEEAYVVLDTFRGESLAWLKSALEKCDA